MTLRFPEVRTNLTSHPTSVTPLFPLIKEPTQDQRDALDSYFHLMSRLYPCGECAAEFQLLLKKYPPQVRTSPSVFSIC